jgi:hypothetical protein
VLGKGVRVKDGKREGIRVGKKERVRVKGGIMGKGEKRVRVKGVNKAGEKGARI